MINNAISENESTHHVYYSVVRNSLANLLNGSPGTVLEVGCGTGKTLAYLKQNGAEKVVGIELRPDVADEAKKNLHIDDVYNIDFLAEDSPLAGKTFDTVILSHVLEHFTETERVLEQIKRHMHARSTLLLAVPNVRHVSVLAPLLFRGDFSYKPSGILDHTHYRFYTKKSISEILLNSGFTITRCEMDFGGPRAKIANRITFSVFEEFLGFAINIAAKIN